MQKAAKSNFSASLLSLLSFFSLLAVPDAHEAQKFDFSEKVELLPCAQRCGLW